MTDDGAQQTPPSPPPPPSGAPLPGAYPPPPPPSYTPGYPPPYGPPQTQPYPPQTQPYPAQGQPYPPQGYPALQGFAPPPYMAPNPYGYPRDHPQAGLALGLGLGGLIGGFFTLGLTFLVSPFAWYIGHKARTAVKQNPGVYHAEGNATAGMVLGIVGTVLLTLAILFWIFVIVAAAGDPNFNSGTSALGTLLTVRS